MCKPSVLWLLVPLVGCQEYNLAGEKPAPDDPLDPAPLDGPAIEVDPLRLDFGQVAFGENPTMTFRIKSIGDEDLEIGDVISDSAAFEVVSETFTLLAPGEHMDATVTYVPQAVLDAGIITVQSNDPDDAEVDVEVYGGVDADAPIAVCSVAPSPVQALYETATWIGSASYDPAGGSLTYDWTLISLPPGSNPQMPAAAPTSPDRAGFMPDVVGTYVGQLVVTNSSGVSSEPCTTELEAIPATDLWVEMFWASPGDDMDLHVVRANANLRSNQDCYYLNCRFGLDWGPGGPEADPILDIDDIGGTGPENINIDVPENVIYQVWVHDYPGSVHQAANDVTVNIYLSGNLAWTTTRTLTGEDTDEHFADVDWSTQSVTPR